MNQIKTKAFRIKTAKAHAGKEALPAVTELALGTGGTTAGAPKSLNGNETGLFHQIFITACEREIQDETTVKYSFKIDSERDNLVDKRINEIGLFDEEGTLVYLQTRSDILVNETDTIDFVVYLEF